MFLLFENWHINTLQEFPELGVAVLLGALKQRDLPVKLIAGQTQFLEQTFLSDMEEIIELYHGLDDAALKAVEVSGNILQVDKNQILTELGNIYKQCVVDKNPRKYLNQILYNEFEDWFKRIIRLQKYYLSVKKKSDIPLLKIYKEEIKKIDPIAIGFSLTHGHNIFSIELCRYCQELGIPVIVGGANYAFVPENQYYNRLENGYINYLVIGPGEGTLPNLIEALEKGIPPDKIPNLVYREKDKIVITQREIPKDLNSIPDPDFSDLNLDKYISPIPVLPFETSRGCYWHQCAFCGEPYITPNYLCYSVERVVNRMSDHINKYGVNHFFLSDEHITPSFSLEIANKINEIGLQVNLYALGRFDSGFLRPNLLNNLRDGGFKVFHWGLESGNQRVINSMKKGIRLNIASEILHTAQRCGIHNLLFVMAGFPTETETELNDTILFIKNHRHLIDAFELSLFDLNRNSPIFQKPENWGVKIIADHEKQEAMGHNIEIPFITQVGMSRENATNTYLSLRKKIELGFLGNNNGVNFVLHNFGLRYINYYFLLDAHHIVEKKEVESLLVTSKYQTLYPVIAGHLNINETGSIFRPIKLNETIDFYKIKQPNFINLSNIETKIFNLSDGFHNINEIIENIYLSDVFDMNTEKNVINFLTRVANNYWGCFFKKSWKH